VSEDGERFRLPRTARITASSEIRALFRRGKRKKTRHLDVFVSSSPVSYARIAIVVPRHRQKVVRRNLVKRRLRELARTLVLPRLNAADQRVDVLLRARPEAYGASFDDLRDELQRMTEELCSSER
jgi:ribonuclease P protein component